MAYSKHTWTKGETISSANLNNIENGIATVETEVKTKMSTPSNGNGTNNQLLKSNGDGTATWISGSLLTGSATAVNKIAEPASAQATDIATALNTLIDALVARGIITSPESLSDIML